MGTEGKIGIFAPLKTKVNMHFLNGSRIFIQPKSKYLSIEEQASSCLAQLKRIPPDKRIYKLNFFADVKSEKEYKQLKQKLQQLVAESVQTSVVCELIAQPPLNAGIIAEAFTFDTSLWKTEFLSGKNGSAMLFRRAGAKVLIGSSQSDTFPGCRENAVSAFNTFTGLLKSVDLPLHSVVRQWNYIENITGFDGENQRYQQFNNVRSAVYENHFSQSGFPAATGIGMNRGGIILEFVAVDIHGAVSQPIDNPEQISAHCYSEKVLEGKHFTLKATPKFERARLFECFGQKQLFISGTASIRGENTIALNDPAKQTEITIQNMQQLYSKKSLKSVTVDTLRPVYGHARVYVKNREDYSAIKGVFENYYGKLPVVYILADICRHDLLVEIEGEAILE
jgi:hypothetical protein